MSAGRLGFVGIAVGKSALPAVDLIRVQVSHLAAAEQYAGAGRAAARLRAEIGHTRSNAQPPVRRTRAPAHVARAQAGEYRRIQHRIGQHEGEAPPCFR